MLKFAVKNILSLIKEYKAIFMMFFSVFSLVAASLIYLHSFNRNLIEEGNRVTSDSRTYTVSGYIEADFAEEIMEEVGNELAENNVVSTVLYAEDTTDLDGVPVRLAIAYGEIDSNQIALDCGSLDMNQNEKEIILNDIFYMENQMEYLIHDKIYLNDETFDLKAIGHIDIQNADALITMKGFHSLDTQITGIDITFENRLKKAELGKLQELFGEQYEVKEPPAYNSTFYRQFLSRFVLSFALILMATFNIMGLYRYIVYRRKREFLIYKIYGINSQKLWKMLLIETFILITGGFLLGVLLIFIISSLKFEWLEITIDFSVLLQTYGIELLCSVVAIVPVLYKLTKKEVFSEYVREDGA